jgi:hypothetical protein
LDGKKDRKQIIDGWVDRQMNKETNGMKDKQKDRLTDEM